MRTFIIYQSMLLIGEFLLYGAGVIGLVSGFPDFKAGFISISFLSIFLMLKYRHVEIFS